jgi:hypothetical protein
MIGSCPTWNGAYHDTSSALTRLTPFLFLSFPFLIWDSLHHGLLPRTISPTEHFIVYFQSDLSSRRTILEYPYLAVSWLLRRDTLITPTVTSNSTTYPITSLISALALINALISHPMHTKLELVHGFTVNRSPVHFVPYYSNLSPCYVAKRKRRLGSPADCHHVGV